MDLASVVAALAECVDPSLGVAREASDSAASG